MPDYELSPEAVTDLEGIWDFIAADQSAAADRVVDELFDAFQHLASWPKLGHYRPDLTDAIVRFWPVKPYLVVYRELADSIEVVAVLHGSRDIPEVLDER
jgi:toxin ParE1/3/4